MNLCLNIRLILALGLARESGTGDSALEFFDSFHSEVGYFFSYLEFSI